MRKIKQAVLGVVIGVVVATASAVPAQGTDHDTADKAWRVLHDIEMEFNIPRGLLHSMSLVETGLGMQNQYLPWPYSINVNSSKKIQTTAENARMEMSYLRELGFRKFAVSNSKEKHRKLSYKAAEAFLIANHGRRVTVRGEIFSKRFENKWQAIFFVNRLLSAGHNNVDVGLLQVNWKYHGHNFESLAHAFDPYHNARYAVSYLMQHRKDFDWWRSVGRYHSKTSKYAERYIDNVWAMYQKVHRLAPQGT